MATNNNSLICKTLRLHLSFLALWLMVFGYGEITLAGPTLHLDYGRGPALANPVNQFMYFVPLISPEPVHTFTNANNTQSARVISRYCHASGETFVATCQFEFIGWGSQRNVLDHTNLIREHRKELGAGHSLLLQLGAINVEGTGDGSVEIHGMQTNGVRSVNEVKMRFNCNGKASPVFITLQDITCSNGAVHVENKFIARVNTLTFQRPGDGDRPKMEVTLASLKRVDAGDSAWQNFMGNLKGMAVNCFLPPITINAIGCKAMLDFGLALANGDVTFKFPDAEPR